MQLIKSKFDQWKKIKSINWKGNFRGLPFANLKEEEKDIYFNKIHEYLAEVLNKELGSIDCEVRLKIFNLRRNKILEIYGYIDIYSFKEKTLIVPANMVEKSIIFTPGHLNYDGI